MIAAGAALAVLVSAVVAVIPAARSTAQPASSPVVHFAVKGDWGYGGAAQARVTRTMCDGHRRRPFAFILTTGDNFYRPDGVATRENFATPEACLVRAGVPWRAAWGNHDLGGDATAVVLRSPRRWYTFASGPLRVVVLDANDPGNRDQLRFLRRTLGQAREPMRIVAFHQPAFTAGAHAPGRVQQRLWVPEFRRGGVALVLQGHNHSYERLVVGGITYVVTGGGGAPVYPCIRLLTRGLRSCLPVHHHLRVDASATGARVRVVDDAGGVRETVWVPARHRQ